MNFLLITNDKRIAKEIATAVKFLWPNSSTMQKIRSIDELNTLVASSDLLVIDSELEFTETYVRITRAKSNIPILYLTQSLGDQIDTARILFFDKVDYAFKPIIMDNLIMSLQGLVSPYKDQINYQITAPNCNN